MNFASPEYLPFLVSTLLILYVLPARFFFPALLAISLFFYAWWDVRFLPLILWVGLCAHFGGRVLSRRKSPIYLWAFIGLLLSPLFYFKYSSFFLESIVYAMNVFDEKNNFFISQVFLPVGISFFTFQAIGYLVDVYGEKLKAEKNPLYTMLFISYFPQIVAGPIERARHLMPQLKKLDKNLIIGKNLNDGFFTIACGLFVKVILADNLAIFVDAVYESPSEFSNLEIMLSTYVFSIQIYCDFYGYTLIAIGSARLFNVELTNNFSHPYFATNIRDFWRCWHITLSNWFRDYVYIPLGGNRSGGSRTIINLLLTMALVGLWHGASWNFVIWGAVHGTLLAAHRCFRHIAERFRFSINPLAASLFGWLITFHAVTLAWIFFRANTFEKAESIFAGFSGGVMEILDGGASVELATNTPVFLMAFIVFELSDRFLNLRKSFARLPQSARIAIIVTVLLIVYSPPQAAEPFIYFQF